MSRNFKLIIGSLFSLLVSISLMLGIFVGINHKNIELILTLQSSITFSEGENRTILYDINIPEAEISFIVADPNIARIENDTVVALEAGSTILRATASYKDKVVHASCKVTISPAPLETNYYHYIQSINGCTYQNETITLAEFAIFHICIYDSFNQLLDNKQIDFSASEGISIEEQFDYFILTATSDGELYFNITELEYSFVIHVKKQIE